MTPTDPTPRAPSLGKIAASCEREAEKFRQMHEQTPVFAEEIAFWSAAASALREYAGDVERLDFLNTLRANKWLHDPGRGDPAWGGYVWAVDSLPGDMAPDIRTAIDTLRDRLTPTSQEG